MGQCTRFFVAPACAVLGMILSTGLAAPAYAAEVLANWVAPVSGDWTDPTRWSSNPFYPSNLDPSQAVFRVTIDVPGPEYVITLNSTVNVKSTALRSADALLLQTGGAMNSASLSIGDVGAGHYRMTGGTLTTRSLLIGAQASSSATAGVGLFEQTGGWYQGGELPTYIGRTGGSGTLSISGAGTRYLAPQTSTLSFAGTHYIGHGSLSHGLAHFRHAVVTLGRVNLGAYEGVGTMLIEGARVTMSRLEMAGSSDTNIPGGDGTLILSGGELTIGPGSSLFEHAYIGSTSGSANLIVNNGTLTLQQTQPPLLLIVRNTGQVTINNGALNSHRQVLINGGRVSVNAGTLTAPHIRLGPGSSAAPGGTLAIHGGRVESPEALIYSSTYLQTGGIGTFGYMQLRRSEGSSLLPIATVSGGTFVAQSLTINDGTFTYAGGSFESGWLTMTDGRLIATPGRDKTIRVGTLSMSGNARIDLGDNVMLLDSGSAPPIATIRALLRSGYNGGAWDGPGIMSSVAATEPGHGIGYTQPSPLFTPLLIAYTRYGDANLDGQVNLADFNALAANFGSTSAIWSMGDFNYDGVVNLQDFNRLAANFGLSASGPEVTPDDWATLAAAVPEPSGALAGFAIATVLFIRRRRFA